MHGPRPFPRGFACRHFAAALILLLCSRSSGGAEQRNELVVINVDGTNLHRIFAEEGVHCGSPRWSHDGKKIAYDSWPVGKSSQRAHTIIINVDGSQPQDLGLAAMPDWSPDDKQLVFHAYGNNTRIMVMNAADGSSRERLAAGGGSPRWSPDGERIAYIRWGENIIVLDTMDGSSRSIVEAGWQPQIGFNWSPDGRFICFRAMNPQAQAPGGGGTQLAVVSTEGTNNQPRVLHRGDVGSWMSWSPDGHRIAFYKREKEKSPRQIYLIDVSEGAEPVRLPGQDAQRDNTIVDWSPDGRQLVFLSAVDE